MLNNYEIIAQRWISEVGVDEAIDRCNKIYQEYGLYNQPAGAIAKHCNNIKNYLLEIKEEYSAEMSWLY